MEEITYSNGFAEIMVDKDESTGAILDIYTYRTDLPNISLPGSWNWTEGRNPVFVHLADKQAAFYSLLENQDNGYYSF